MAKAPAVDPSTRPLSEVARHIVIPSGIVDTLWFEVEERCREFGDEFDAWQDGLGQVVLGLRDDGMFAATVGGVTLSIPRQVAKTFIVMRIVVALCTMFPNLTVVWTAHRLRTATNTFQKMKTLALRPGARVYLQPGSNQGTAIRDANGEQQIPFRNGSVILFGAREQGFGRGFDEIDIEVFDEAQILTDRAIDDMAPAANQSRFEYGALLFYMGTPPRPVDPGEVFTDRRDEALAFKGDNAVAFGPPVVGEDSVYIECSADEDADPDDRKQWAKANPSYPHRTTEIALRRLRKQLTSPDSWRREALGVWDKADVVAEEPALIDPDRWHSLAGDPPDDGTAVYGVKFSANGQTVALAGAIRPEAGLVYVEGISHRLVVDGTRWLVDFLTPRKAKVAIDGRAGAAALETALRRAGVPAARIKRPTVDEAIAAYGGFVNAVATGELTQPADEGLTTAALAVIRRPIGNQGGWGYAGRDGADVTPVEAVALAHWLAANKTPRSGRTSGGRRATVMT